MQIYFLRMKVFNMPYKLLHAMELFTSCLSPSFKSMVSMKLRLFLDFCRPSDAIMEVPGRARVNSVPRRSPDSLMYSSGDIVSRRSILFINNLTIKVRKVMRQNSTNFWLECDECFELWIL